MFTVSSAANRHVLMSIINTTVKSAADRKRCSLLGNSFYLSRFILMQSKMGNTITRCVQSCIIQLRSRACKKWCKQVWVIYIIIIKLWFQRLNLNNVFTPLWQWGEYSCYRLKKEFHGRHFWNDWYCLISRNIWWIDLPEVSSISPHQLGFLWKFDLVQCEGPRTEGVIIVLIFNTNCIPETNLKCVVLGYVNKLWFLIEGLKKACSRSES